MLKGPQRHVEKYKHIVQIFNYLIILISLHIIIDISKEKN